jgi:hypothetical protein
MARVHVLAPLFVLGFCVACSAQSDLTRPVALALLKKSVDGKPFATLSPSLDRQCVMTELRNQPSAAYYTVPGLADLSKAGLIEVDSKNVSDDVGQVLVMGEQIAARMMKVRMPDECRGVVQAEFTKRGGGFAAGELAKMGWYVIDVNLTEKGRGLGLKPGALTLVTVEKRASEVTGIVKVDESTRSVDYVVTLAAAARATELGLEVRESGAEMVGTATLRKYDDGWRVIDVGELKERR